MKGKSKFETNNMDLERALEYKKTFKQEAETILYEDFPRTILQLNALLETPRFKKRTFEPDTVTPVAPPKRTRPNTNKRKICNNNSDSDEIPSTPISSNRDVVDTIDTVKPHMIKLLDNTRILKMWLSLLVPKVEEGYSFGSEIHGGIVEVVKVVEDIGVLFFNVVAAYFEERGKLMKKSAKYPFMEDYRRAVKELDEKMYLGQCCTVTEIRNSYVILHDVVMKNMEKIKTPRTRVAAEFFYGTM